MELILANNQVDIASALLRPWLNKELFYPINHSSTHESVQLTQLNSRNSTMQLVDETMVTSRFCKSPRRSLVADIDNSVNSISYFFDALIGKRCWSVIAGPDTGSMASLAFGEKIRRSRPLRNSTLSSDQREFDGELVVFIKGSEWSIFYEKYPVCSSNDSNEINGPMLAGLQRLIGRKVVEVNITDALGGLDLFFDGALRLQLNGTVPADDFDSYSLFYRGHVVADVGGNR